MKNNTGEGKKILFIKGHNCFFITLDGILMSVPFGDVKIKTQEDFIDFLSSIKKDLAHRILETLSFGEDFLNLYKEKDFFLCDGVLEKGTDLYNYFSSLLEQYEVRRLEDIKFLEKKRDVYIKPIMGVKKPGEAIVFLKTANER